MAESEMEEVMSEPIHKCSKCQEVARRLSLNEFQCTNPFCPATGRTWQRFWLLCHDMAETENEAEEYCYGIFSTIEKAKSYFKDGYIISDAEADSIEWSQPHLNQEIFQGLMPDGNKYEIRSQIVDEV